MRRFVVVCLGLLDATRLHILGLCLLFALAGLSTRCWAATEGSVSGTVTDPSKAVLRGASITAINLDTAVHYRISTNESGFYSFPDLPVGSYDLFAERLGSRPIAEPV